jgi:hypothetical protein
LITPFFVGKVLCIYEKTQHYLVVGDAEDLRRQYKDYRCCRIIGNAAGKMLEK